MDKIIALLKEQSTWKGLVIIAGLIGYQLDAANVGAILQAAAGLYAAIAVLWDRN